MDNEKNPLDIYGYVFLFFLSIFAIVYFIFINYAVEHHLI